MNIVHEMSQMTDWVFINELNTNTILILKIVSSSDDHHAMTHVLVFINEPINDEILAEHEMTVFNDKRVAILNTE